MSNGPQKFRKTELRRVLDVAGDRSVVLRPDGTMILQAGKQSPATSPTTLELASDEYTVGGDVVL